MRILVVGAGAIGGYFGGRLLAAGRDVTFLVRPRRAEELARDGLQIKSPLGDVMLPNPPTVLADTLRAPFDLVIVSCKAYDLDDAIASLAPAVGPETAILPLLNGMRHMEALEQRFGGRHVLGGVAAIGSTLNERRAIVQLNELHDIVFGERDGTLSDRVKAIKAETTGALFNARASETIMQEMWEKWVFLASLAAATCLMRTSTGDIVAAPGGRDLLLGLHAECAAAAQACGYPPRKPALEGVRAMLTTPNSAWTASMFRDIEQGARIEADHIVGDLIARRDNARITPQGASLLDIAYTHLKAYENRRAREQKAS